MENKEKKFLSLDGLTSYDNKLKAKIAVNEATILQNAKDYSDGLKNALDINIKANTDAISILNGNETSTGSVKKQVADAVAKIIADAPEAYDTLKEISDWISSHNSDASSMNSKILENKNSITSLTNFVGTLPDKVASTTIIDYITEVIKASEKDITSSIITAKQETINAASVDATAKSNKSLSDSKTYTDELANGAVATNTSDIVTLKTRVDTIEAEPNIIEITTEEIDALFA